MSQHICALTVLPMDRSVFKSFSLYCVPAGHFFELMKQIIFFCSVLTQLLRSCERKSDEGLRTSF